MTDEFFFLEGDGFPVWAIVVIVIAGTVLLGVATHLLLVWLLFKKSSVKVTGESVNHHSLQVTNVATSQ